MSAVSNLSSPAGVNYATQLAQTSALQRGLYNLGAAVQNGDLSSAGSILTAFIKANPQYASTSDDGSQSQDPINQDFQALTNAISNNQADDAKTAWAQLKSDLAKNGITNLTDGAAATAQLLNGTKDSIAQQILTDTFAVSSGTGPSITSLLAGGNGPSPESGLPTSLIANWLTYQSGGNTSPLATPPDTAATLNTTA